MRPFQAINVYRISLESRSGIGNDFIPQGEKNVSRLCWTGCFELDFSAPSKLRENFLLKVVVEAIMNQGIAAEVECSARSSIFGKAPSYPVSQGNSCYCNDLN